MPLRAKIQNAAFTQSAKMSLLDLPKELPGDEADDVLFGSIYGVRSVELNRPKKLNSLNGSMARKILPRLKEWEKSDLANVVIMAGAGEKALCAGGDVAALADYNKEGPEGQQRSKDYFGLEYQLDHVIATYKKPYIAYMDGITMGGGVGLSVHAPFRIVTERTVFAMPETKIGFFPDVGGGFFLPRLDGYIGRYLALTSETLKGVNVYYAGIGTHYLHSSILGELTERLSELDFADSMSYNDRLKAVNATIDEFATGLPHDEVPELVGKKRNAIDRCFKYNTIEEILEALKAEEKGRGADIAEWARATSETMLQRSPTSLRVTLKQLVLGGKWTIAETFQNENNIASRFMEHPDFVEGVNALLKKPTRKPQWKPAKLKDVTDQAVDQFFLGRGQRRLQLFSEGNYSQYSERGRGDFGLPSEATIAQAINSSTSSKSGPVVESLLKECNYKMGAKEKINEVLNRKCKTNERGYLVWQE